MAIAFGAAGSRLLVGTATTSWAVPYPATVNADDLLVLHIVTNGGTVTTPSGWTAVFDETTLTNPKGGLFIKVADGSETGNLTVTVGSTTGNAMMFSYTGVDTTTPQDATATNSTDSTGSTLDTTIPGLTTVTAGAWLVYANGLNSGSTQVTTSNGSGFTERVDHGATGGTGTKGGALYDEPFPTAGATGNRVLTLSAARADWGAMMALRPASGGGSPQTLSPTGAASSEAFGSPSVGANTSTPSTFDDGTADGWTSSTGGAGTTAITNAAAHDGSYGTASDVPAATGDKAGFTRSIGPAQSGTIRGWWKVTTEGASSGSNVPFARLFYGTQRLADVYRQNQQAGANVWLRVVKAIGGSNYYFIPTGYTLPLDTWVYISFTWGLDGIPHLFIDGVEYLNASDAPADFYPAPQIDTAWLGSQEAGNQGAWAIDTVDAIARPTPVAGEIRNEPTLTGEGFGAPSVTISDPPLEIDPTGIATAEAFGTAAISTSLTSSPAGVASAGAFGTPALSTTLATAPTGVASAEAFGAPSISATLQTSPTGIASGQALGSPSLTIPAGLAPTGIASEEAVGTPFILATVQLDPAGIASAEAHGSPDVGLTLDTSVSGIASAEAFGTVVIVLGTDLSPDGLPTGEAFGNPGLTATLDVTPAGVASAEAFGSPGLTIPRAITATGIASAEAFGQPDVTVGPAGTVVSPTGITTGQAFGVPQISGNRTVSLSGIPSLQAFGSPKWSSILVTRPLEVDTGDGLGVPTVHALLTTSPAGIQTKEAFGVPTVEKIVLIVSPAGSVSFEAFGVPRIRGGSTSIPIEMAGTLARPPYSGRIQAPGDTNQTPNRWEGTLG